MQLTPLVKLQRSFPMFLSFQVSGQRVTQTMPATFAGGETDAQGERLLCEFGQRVRLPRFQQYSVLVTQSCADQVFLKRVTVGKQPMVAIELVRKIAGNAQVFQYKIGEALVSVAKKEYL
jgi:hypothetical protein